MALADRVADALAADSRFASVGGTSAWSIYVALMPDKPASAVAVYDRPNVDEGAQKETGAVRIVARGKRYGDAVDKIEAAIEVMAGQPLADWLAMGESGREDAGEDDSRRAQVATEITFRRLCDRVTIQRYKRQSAPLTYSYGLIETVKDVPALVAVGDGGARETYRGALVQRDDVQVYVKADNASVGDRIKVVTADGTVDVDSIIRRGTGCARNVLVMSGARRLLV